MNERRDHTRAAIVEAARQLMTAHGVRATTIEQIAREAYVSVGAIYTHFAGKPGLALHFLDLGLTELERGMGQARELSSPIERINAAGEAYFAHAVRHPIAAQFATVRVLDPDPAPEYAEANDVCARRIGPIVRDLARDVRAAMEAGQIRTAPVEETTTYLWALWTGAATLMLRRDELSISVEAGRRALEAGQAFLGVAGPTPGAARGQPRPSA